MNTCRAAKIAGLVITGSSFLAACSTLDRVLTGEKYSKAESFEDRLARYDEKVLSREQIVDENGVVLVATKRCKVADKQRLDAMFPISEAREIASEKVNAPFGLPLADDPNSNEFFLYQDEYILLYNSALKLPTFATYRLRSEDIQQGDRFECFRVDPRLEADERSKTTDYHGDTDLDKGHLVPDADMQRSVETVMNTYYMSNMMPQFGSVNSGSWVYIENATRLWADELGEVYVVSGPIFDRDGNNERDADVDAERAPPTRRVAKPTAFFRIIMNVSDDGEHRAIAFELPHIQASTSPNKDYVPTKLTSIDEIEKVTGYDFFPDLPDDVEDPMEAAIESDLWCREECDGAL